MKRRKVVWYSFVLVLILGVTLLSNFVKAETPNQNKWVVNDQGAAIIVEYNSYNKFALMGKCNGEGILALYDLTNYKPSSIGSAMLVKLRVDKMGTLTTQGTLTDDNGTVALLVDEGGAMLGDMKRGNYLRVAFRDDASKEFVIVEKYSLNGFTSAFNRSKDMCAQGVQQHQEYFPDDGDFF